MVSSSWRICTVNAGCGGFVCPCHFATFNLDGAVTGGPAPSPLVHFACMLDKATGQVCVNTGTIVGSSVRLKA